jgi:hypothetical protein
VKKSYAAQRQFVGVDLARRRSVIARMDPGGEVVDCVQIDNSERDLVAEIAKAGPGAPVAVEATFGWYWAVAVLQAAGHEVHLAHPKGNASTHNRRVKTDARDAAELARLLRMGDLAESWIAPPVVRARREFVRHPKKPMTTPPGWLVTLTIAHILPDRPAHDRHLGADLHLVLFCGGPEAVIFRVQRP